MVEYTKNIYGLCPIYILIPNPGITAIQAKIPKKMLIKLISDCLIEIKYIISINHNNKLPNWYHKFEQRIDKITKVSHLLRKKPIRMIYRFEKKHHSSFVHNAIKTMIWALIPLWKSKSPPHYFIKFMGYLSVFSNVNFEDLFLQPAVAVDNNTKDDAFSSIRQCSVIIEKMPSIDILQSYDTVTDTLVLHENVPSTGTINLSDEILSTTQPKTMTDVATQTDEPHFVRGIMQYEHWLNRI